MNELLHFLCHPLCKLKILNLSSCGLTDEHAARLIEVCHTIVALLTQQILSFNQTLKKVFLKDNNFTDETVSIFQKMVNENTTQLPLTRLKLRTYWS